MKTTCQSAATRPTLTDAERKLLPTPEDVRGYAEPGWYLSERLFDDTELDELQAAAEEYYASARDRALPVRPPNPAEPSNLVPWHVDKHYWQTTTSDRMLTAFIPFHDCDEHMGTIGMRTPEAGAVA
jgi:hypothetical protein